MDDYTHISYRNKPYFNIGTANQWYEEGCFYSKRKYFFYADDRQDFNYHVEIIAETKQDFIAYCQTKKIKIPVIFWGEVKRMQ